MHNHDFFSVLQFGQSVDVPSMGNKTSHSESEDSDPAAAHRLPPRARTQEGPDDEPEVVEVPPPMRPISSVPAADEAASSSKKVRPSLETKSRNRDGGPTPFF